MGGSSNIEWTDATWNPVRGCSMAPGSEDGGCLNCYAARQAARNLTGLRSPSTGKPFAVKRTSGPRWTGEVELIPSLLDWPLRWRGHAKAKAEGRSSRIFVNSMSDLFHEVLSFEEIAAVFGVMAAAHWHTFQALTKRASRMPEFFAWLDRMAERVATVFPDDSLNWRRHHIIRAAATRAGVTMPDPYPEEVWPLPNVWLGVSAENQATAEARVPWLIQTPAAVRFVSAEPLLGALDLTRLEIVKPAPPYGPGTWLNSLTGHMVGPDDILPDHLDWVICGGESGPGARPFCLEWARDVARQCRDANVACFVKQLGAYPKLDGRRLSLRDRKGGDWSEWPEDLRVREFPRLDDREHNEFPALMVERR